MSTSDNRTENNAMRHQYRTLSPAEKELITLIKTVGDQFLSAIEFMPGREASIARTKIEEAVMWAVKGVTK